ncbi:MAG: hypothetical protein U1E59_10880 [Amaricoccus sp.]
MRNLLPPVAIVAALALPGAATAGGCDAPLAAAKKLDTVPYKMHSVTLAVGGDAADADPEVADMIATNDKLYFEVDGAWQAVPRDMSGLGDLDDDVASGDVTCRQLADAEVNGVPTVVYAIDDKAQPDVTEQTVWIGKDSGLMMRAQSVMDEGDGDGGKSQTTMDFAFDDVKAPEGVE